MFFQLQSGSYSPKIDERQGQHCTTDDELNPHETKLGGGRVAPKEEPHTTRLKKPFRSDTKMRTCPIESYWIWIVVNFMSHSSIHISA